MNKLSKFFLVLPIVSSLVLTNSIVASADVSTSTVTSSSTASVEYHQTGKLKYNLVSGSLQVIGYTGNDEIITIPSEFLGYKVTAISDNAFVNDPSLTTLIIPTGITYSDNLASVIIEGDTSVTIVDGTITPVTPATPTISTSTVSSTSSPSTVDDVSTSTISTGSCSVPYVPTVTVSATSTTSTSTLTIGDSTSDLSKTADDSSLALITLVLVFTTVLVLGISPVGYSIITKLKSKIH